MSMVRRVVGRHSVWVILAALVVVVSAAAFFPMQKPPVIRVGILHSLTGPLAASEKPIVDATLLAIDQINATGGVLGRQIEPVVADGRSTPSAFAEQAEYLIKHDRVDAIFGGYTPAVRRAIRSVVEKYHGVLFYPGRNEGFEQSPNIVYVGPSPNQHVTFSVHWALSHLGHHLYLVGTDALYPHVANAIIRKYTPLMGGKVLGEHYLAPGSAKMESVIDDIRRLHPDVVVSTMMGGDNAAFLHAMAAAGLGPENIPLLSLQLSAMQAKTIGADAADGYVAGGYFQAIDTPLNRTFVAAFRKRYGEKEVISCGMEAAYVAVHLWARAVAKSGTPRPDIVLQAVRQKSLVAPEGIISVDYDTNHAWRYARIGRVKRDGDIEIVASSGEAIRPQVVSMLLSQDEANRLFARLHHRWGGHWIAPHSDERSEISP